MYVYMHTRLFSFMCVYTVYMHAFMYVGIYVGMYVYVYIWIHVCMHVCTQVYTCICIHINTCMHARMHACVCVHPCMCLQTCINKHNRICVGVHRILSQGARSTSNENAWIAQRAVGCRNRRIPRIPQIHPESRSTEMQRWAIVCGTKLFDLKIWNNFDTNLPWQKSFVFLSRQICMHIIWYFQNKNLVPQIIAHLWISVLRDSGRICGILGIRRFRQPTAYCGIHAFSFEVDLAPSLIF